MSNFLIIRPCLTQGFSCRVFCPLDSRSANGKDHFFPPGLVISVKLADAKCPKYNLRRLTPKSSVIVMLGMGWERLDMVEHDLSSFAPCKLVTGYQIHIY